MTAFYFCSGKYELLMESQIDYESLLTEVTYNDGKSYDGRSDMPQFAE